MKKKHSVLVIDDEPLNIFTLSQILGDEFIVLVGNGPAEGIETAKRMLPDIILLDVVMPGMNGFEVLGALQNDSYTKNIPVIFVTGKSDLQGEEQGLYLGAVDFIHKPYTGHIVKLRIRNQLKILTQMRMIQELTAPNPLSGKFARKYFISMIDEELHRAARAGTTLGFAIFNVDNYSIFNGMYGYGQGEMLMHNLTEMVQSRLARPGDKAVRWGGDEFVLMLPETNMDGVLKVADDIRKIVEGYRYEIVPGETTSVTVSAGISAVQPKLNTSYLLEYSVEELISDTTEALKTAKAEGKNKVSW